MSLARRLKQLLRPARLVSGHINAATGYPPDFNATEIADLEAVRPFTMTSAERIVSLIRAVQYVVDSRIPGDIVECGVFKGGSMLAAVRTLLRNGDTSRQLYLYDTFEGMAQPTAADVSVLRETALSKWKRKDRWCYAGLEEVRQTLLATGYPAANMHFIKGKVEDTIPAAIPDSIALLRLDTDWYESTRHELQHLYPLLVSRGVIIIDDYGHWQGARQATDEYLQAHNIPLLLSRIDYTARIGVKAA